MPTPVAMQGNSGGNIGDNLGMSGKNARSGRVDVPRSFGADLTARELNMRNHFVQPANDTEPGMTMGGNMKPRERPTTQNQLPFYYNQYDGLPAPIDADDEQKENLRLKSAIRQAANQEIADFQAQNGGVAPGVVRTDPITQEEVQYLKGMKDLVEVAKFDDYVESFIDPRQPGNMKWLMEVYPDYVNRRLQQAHTDYEFALRNQMIDSWGINTFDDLHFKYLVDQGKINGPSLKSDRMPLDMSYAPGVASYWNFQSPNTTDGAIAYPFASAKHGKAPRQTVDANGQPTGPRDPSKWRMDRTGRPLGYGHSNQALANGMFQNSAFPEGRGERPNGYGTVFTGPYPGP